jgi:hypothetical protein
MISLAGGIDATRALFTRATTERSPKQAVSPGERHLADGTIEQLFS